MYEYMYIYSWRSTFLYLCTHIYAHLLFIFTNKATHYVLLGDGLSVVVFINNKTGILEGLLANTKELLHGSA